MSCGSGSGSGVMGCGRHAVGGVAASALCLRPVRLGVQIDSEVATQPQRLGLPLEFGSRLHALCVAYAPLQRGVGVVVGGELLVAPKHDTEQDAPQPMPYGSSSAALLFLCGVLALTMPLSIVSTKFVHAINSVPHGVAGASSTAWQCCIALPGVAPPIGAFPCNTHQAHCRPCRGVGATLFCGYF